MCVLNPSGTLLLGFARVINDQATTGSRVYGAGAEIAVISALASG
jgi:hypothetical protein